MTNATTYSEAIIFNKEHEAVEILKDISNIIRESDGEVIFTYDGNKTASLIPGGETGWDVIFR